MRTDIQYESIEEPASKLGRFYHLRHPRLTWTLEIGMYLLAY